MKSFQELLDDAEIVARDLLVRHGEIPQRVIGHKPDGSQVVLNVTPAPTAVGRHQQAMKVGDVLRERGVTSYVVMYEAWISDTENLGGDVSLPSEDPERVDAAVLEAHDALNRSIRYLRINRSGPAPTLIPMGQLRSEGTQPGGTYDGLLHEPQ